MPSKSVTSIGPYQILPIAIPATPAYNHKVTHHLYIRPHTPKIPTATDERSLFLVNVPVDSTPQHFRAIFNTLIGAGRFESITFEGSRHRPAELQVAEKEPAAKDKKRKRTKEDVVLPSASIELPAVWDRELHKSGSTAVVVLADRKMVESVLKAVKKVHKSGDHPVWGMTPEGKPVKAPALGSARYLMHQKLRFPDKAELQASVDAYMAAFNSKEEAAAREAKRVRNEPDEDGFITVTRGGRTGPARKEEAEEARRKELEKEEEKRKSMGDFYRFQGRERRKEEQKELVRQFEEDRKRVEELKAQRGKFRPET